MNMFAEINQIFEDAMEPEASGFRVTDDGAAEWALNKIREAKAEQSRMEEHYKAQLSAISERISKKIEFMTWHLNQYFHSVPRHITKSGIEKYALPSGELTLKPAGIDYERDNDALLEWCKANHPELVKIKEEPAWADVKKYISETGEIPPGVTPAEKPASFSVKAN